MGVLDDDVVVDGVRLAYRDHGEGPAVVFVHGTLAHAVIWRDVLPAVEAAGYRVIAYELLDRLEVGRCALVGHDIGGAVGQLLAVDRPERLARLVLVDTVSYDSWASETWQAIIDGHLDGYAAMGAEDFEALLAGQLTMTVADSEGMHASALSAARTLLRRAARSPCLVRADLSVSLPFGTATVDRIVCHNTLECLPDPQRLPGE